MNLCSIVRPPGKTTATSPVRASCVVNNRNLSLVVQSYNVYKEPLKSFDLNLKSTAEIRLQGISRENKIVRRRYLNTIGSRVYNLHEYVDIRHVA